MQGFKNTAPVALQTSPGRILPAKRKAPHLSDTWRNGCWESDIPIDVPQPNSIKLLCTRCRQINFGSILNIQPTLEITEQGHTVFDLSSLGSFSKDIECNLCKLFALVVDRNRPYEDARGERSEKWHLRAFTTCSLWSTPYVAMVRAQQLSIVLAVCDMPDVEYDRSAGQLRTTCIQRGVILPCQDSIASDLKRSIKCMTTSCLRRVDFELIKIWLSNCDRDHPKCSKRRKEAMEHPVRAKVIDCRTRRLVALTPTTKYITLSYVWGPNRQEDSSRLQTGGPQLPAQLPRTIESAIIATRALGFQYLWVDRYCIDQGHSEDKTHQINQMANIYSHAVVTICALGEHDDIDLPGVPCDRKKQLRVQVQDLTLAWTGPGIRRILQHSPWMSRGWTYQETVLSGRCLFFTEYYTALICETKVSVENIVSGDFPAWSFNKDAQIWQEEQLLGRPLYPAQAFFKHVAEFRKRKLSFKSDMLNAFKGILSQLEVQSYWGIPVYRVTSSPRGFTRLTCEQEPEAGFLAGLCWKTRQSTSPALRPQPPPPASSGDLDDLGFPSWSWVGSNHSMISNHVGESLELQVASSYFSCFQAGVAVRGLDNMSISFRDLAEIYRCSKVISEQTRFLELTSIIVTWERRYQHTNEQQIKDKRIERQKRKEQRAIESRTENQETKEKRAMKSRLREVRQRSRPTKDRVVTAHPTQKIPWWQLDTLGDLYLDTDITNAEQYGHAVLLGLDLKAPARGTYGSIRAVWLAVEKVADGTFRRRGIIVLNHMGKLDWSTGPPGAGWLETIVLG